MSKKNRLLVPVDGSRQSLRALAHVISRVATGSQLQLVVVNVQPPLPPSLFVSRAMIARYQERHGETALKRARGILLRRHMTAEFLLRIGEPAEMIVKTARQAGCSEIIMGSRGLGSLKGLFLGSVTTKVIHAARVPVTIVP